MGNRWSWQWICAQGRVLAYSLDSWETDMDAWNAAKAYRTDFWGRADWIDHRMGACM